MNENHQNLTDSELYTLCRKWGSEALEARRKFIGLLPEVFKRRLYERRNFTSIYHFAGEIGGVSERLVNEVLRLEKRFENMPTLHLALVKGEIGLSKLARVASVVEVENEAEICEKIRNLSRRAVDVLVKETGLNNKEATTTMTANGFFVMKNGRESLSGQNFDWEILANLSPEVKRKLKELIDKKIDINEILLATFAEREAVIDTEKEEIGETKAKSRYIPVRIKKIIEKEFGNKCAAQGCQKPAEQIHHEKHFSLYRDHDPRGLKPLCRGHHEMAHAR